MGGCQLRTKYIALVLTLMLYSFMPGFTHADEASVPWAQLTDTQRQVLNPLAAEWDTLRPWQREKMLDHQQFQALTEEKKSGLRKKWQEYQKLPESERARLRAESPDVYTDADLN